VHPHDDPEDHDRHQQVKKESHLDHERESGGDDQAGYRYSVLQGEEPDGLGYNVGTEDDEDECDQHHSGGDGEGRGGKGHRVHLEGSHGEEPERGDGEGDQDHAGHAEHGAAGQVDVGVTEQPHHEARDQHDLEHEGEDGQDVKLIDVARGGYEHSEPGHHQRLEGVELHLGAQEGCPQHGELGQEDEHGRHVGDTVVGGRNVVHHPPPA
jgi:hypothetical protein